jgi:hypothetical protein
LIPSERGGRRKASIEKRLRAMEFFRFDALLAGNLIAVPLQQH